MPLRDWLEDAFGRPVQLDNDANAAALAEWRFGAGQGARHLVYLTMSTGIGAGLILDGRLYRGVRAGAGELGHVQLEWDGDPCGCGLRGCAEAYLGGAALARRLRRIAPAESRVVALAGRREQVTARHLVAAAQEDDAFARAEMARYVHYLGRLLALTVFALAPEVDRARHDRRRCGRGALLRARAPPGGRDHLAPRRAGSPHPPRRPRRDPPRPLRPRRLFRTGTDLRV